MAVDEQPTPGEFFPGGAGLDLWQKKNRDKAWDAWQKAIRDKVNAAYELPEGLTWEWADESQDAIGHIFKAALTSPPGTYTYEPASEDRFADCPACGTPWGGCEASQPYADEEDPACCGGCEHEWISPPPAYTIEPLYPRYMVLNQRGAPLYVEMPLPQTPLSPLTFFTFDEPEEPPAPHLNGGPWAAVEALRGPFFPWGRKP